MKDFLVSDHEGKFTTSRYSGELRDAIVGGRQAVSRAYKACQPVKQVLTEGNLESLWIWIVLGDRTPSRVCGTRTGFVRSSENSI